MKNFFKKALPYLFVSVLFLTTFQVQALEKNKMDNSCYTQSMADLKMTQQKLWMQHVGWTRNYITSTLASLEDQATVAERLLKNQADIGSSIKPYYGEDAGNKLTDLLKEHVTTAGQVVNATKTDNKEALTKYNKLWYENADAIANFLSSTNPNYSNKALKSMLHEHLKLTTDELVASLNKDWKANIAAYDKGEDHMIMFADMLSEGIIKQFPDKFK